jgi:hypothetical protein
MKRRCSDELCVLFEKRIRMYTEEDCYWSIYVVNSGMGSISFLRETLDRYKTIKCNQIQKYLDQYIMIMTSEVKLNIDSQIKLFQLVLKIDTFLIENYIFD